MKKESVFQRTKRSMGYPVSKTNFRKAVRHVRELFRDPQMSQAQCVRTSYARDIMYGDS